MTKKESRKRLTLAKDLEKTSSERQEMTFNNLYSAKNPIPSITCGGIPAGYRTTKKQTK